MYRLLFLMAAEERRLIFPPDADTTRQAVYAKYYSVTRLRDRADQYFAGDDNGDLWLGLRQTFRLFRDHDAAQKLGLAALDGELFGPHACEDLEGARCTNEALLCAIRCLSTFVDDGGVRRRRASGVRRRVNYAGLNVEEFGSVYESLLDYHPQVTLDPSTELRVGPPRFDLVAGSERKQTGSYYTPPELVRELIESALVPVMEEKLRAAKTRDEKIRALLDLRVCDPAAGSGHFLLAAARRIARELAKVRSGEDEPAPDEYRRALRDVIRQCVYAVDKNPLAVDLCKVALWIEGHNAGLPLSFLDHHVKCGDSLVGVFDLKVLEEGIPDEAYKPVTGDDKTAARYYRDRNRRERRGQTALALAGQAIEIPDELAETLRALGLREERRPEDVHAKEELYDQLRARGSEWWKLKVACDLWTYAFFAPLQMPGPDNVDHVPTTDTVRRALANRGVDAQVRAEANALSSSFPFFHWPLEFPDVFMNGGFDVVLSNPPFMGGLKISDRFGDAYRQYLTTLFAPAGGTADLAAYFYRRAFDLLRPGGHLGMVATNTIGQGDTREGGLAVVVRNGGTINFAHRFIKWPGAANVEVNLVAIRKHDSTPTVAERAPLLDGKPVEFISSRLDAEPEAEPKRLPQNEDKAFQGDIVRGIGFVLEPEEAEGLVAEHPRNAECLFPYLNGEDLNSHPEQRPSRYVICFHDWNLERARQYPDLLQIVEERVKPERDRLRGPGDKRNREYWWQFGAYRAGMRAAIAPLRRVLVLARITEHFGPLFVPKGWVYNEKTVVFAFDDYYHFALLQANVHELWARKHSSTLESCFNYAPTDCFDTFPFPQEPSPEDRQWAARVGAEYHEHRRQIMLARNLGLTKTYNLFHNADCADEDIVRLRELHAEMDRAILACYGWQDVDPGHGFHQNERGQTRYTVSPDARREILRRLLDLNLRVADEVRS